MNEEQRERAPLSLPAELSRTTVAILREHTGRGANSARTVIDHDSVMVILGDTLLKSERTLVEAGEDEFVLEERSKFQRTMRNDLVAAVERIVGRPVKAFMSANHIDPDIGVEVFILEPRDEGPPAEPKAVGPA